MGENKSVVLSYDNGNSVLGELVCVEGLFITVQVGYTYFRFRRSTGVITGSRHDDTPSFIGTDELAAIEALELAKVA